MNINSKQKAHYILGIQCYANHDSGAAVVSFDEDGTVLDYVAISEERLIRKKYPYCFPTHSIAYCMDYFGLTALSEFDILVTDYIRLKRWFNSGPSYLISEFDYYKIKFDFDLNKIVTISHHLAHAASTYYASGFRNSAVLVVDGNGSGLQSNSFFSAEGTDIQYIDSYKGHGIGAAYASVSNWILDFGTGGEGKTMGLAPYGDNSTDILNIEGKFSGAKTDFSGFMRRMPHSDVLNHLVPGKRKNPIHRNLRTFKNGDSYLDPYFCGVAHDIQKEAERALVHLGKSLYEKTESKNICMAGGVALNSVANKIMFDATEFENIFVFPACSDAGIPFGLALWGYYKSREFSSLPKKYLDFSHAYTGINYSDTEIKAALERHSIPYKKCDAAEVAGLIADGNIVGWYIGGSEYGPRALGHRSILADSRRKEMKDIINDKIKHRESFRPFAPAVLAECCSEYFDLEGESPFMLLVAEVLKPDIIPSVTHVDGTARVQTVTRESNGKFYDLINEFKKITGVPVILNTSFNDAGEPIVETPEDALICFLNTGMDVLVLENYLIQKKDLNKKYLTPRLITERDDKLKKRESSLIKKFFPNFDEQERDHFIAESNKMSEWHALYRSKYELEKKIIEWRANNVPIIIVGSQRHTALLVEKINGFYGLNIRGFVEYMGSEEIAPDQKSAYTRFNLQQLKRVNFDEFLVSSYDYMYDISSELEEKFFNKPIYKIYDESSRSFFETLEHFPSYKLS